MSDHTREGMPNDPEQFNLGLNFILMFRWLLLLLFALLIHKAAEGITYSLTTQPIYGDLHVYTPIFGSPENPSRILLMPNWQYLVGVLQMIVTLLFAARYFLCLVDPLERISGIHSEQVKITDFRQIKKSLQHIRMWHVILVLAVAIPEFLLLFHAATSFRSYHQWISFLMLLVLWDSLVFFVVVGNLHHVVSALIWTQKKKLRLTHGIVKQKQGAKLRKTFLSQRGRAALTDLLDQFQRETRKRLGRYRTRKQRYGVIKSQLKRTRTDYGPWNLFDGFVLLICLIDEHFYHTSRAPNLLSSGWLDPIITVLFLLLMLFFSIFLTYKFIAKIENRPKLWRLLIPAMMLLLIVSILMYLDSRGSGSNTVGASEFFVLITISVAIAYFSYLNYKMQPELWERHLAMLQLKP